MESQDTWIKKIGKLPETPDEFLSIFAAIGTTPQGSAACLIMALMEFVKNENSGKKMITSVVDPSRLVDRGEGVFELFQADLKFIALQSKGKEYMFNSYVLGTSPDNAYKIEKMPVSFEFSSNKYSEAMGDCRYKIFVKSSGAATPRPVTLAKQADGYWKAIEYSSLLLDVVTKK
ncbi:hypothetical protein JXL83_04115 [candidate division WOR-3 bacterium]|nr:hypothetical protein [candidate division WOR-3 bacterium]